MTSQRRAVLDLFMRHQGGHLTAGEVLSSLRRRLPEMARATAYNALEDECRAGLLHGHAAEGGVLRYGLNLGAHDHFVCLGCRRWFDVPADGRPGRHCVPDDFAVERIEVTYSGYCGACRGAGQEPTAAGRPVAGARQAGARPRRTAAHAVRAAAPGAAPDTGSGM